MKYNIIMEKKPSVMLNTTFTHKIDNIAFDNLPKDICIDIFKDGRPFSHFIEHWISNNYPIKHVSGCGPYDFIDENDPTILYDEKTFTKKGLKFCPSNMIGTGRKFNEELFKKKCESLIFCVVSNIKFPEIKIIFLEGKELALKYPRGRVPIKDYDNIFK